MFFLSVICQHSVLNQLTEEPEVMEVKLASAHLCGWDTARCLGEKKREDALLNPNKLVGWLSPSQPYMGTGQPNTKNVKSLLKTPAALMMSDECFSNGQRYSQSTVWSRNS